MWLVGTLNSAVGSIPTVIHKVICSIVKYICPTLLQTQLTYTQILSFSIYDVKGHFRVCDKK